MYKHAAILGLTGGRALYLYAGLAGAAALAVHTIATLLLRACGARGLFSAPPPPLAMADAIAPLHAAEADGAPRAERIND